MESNQKINRDEIITSIVTIENILMESPSKNEEDKLKDTISFCEDKENISDQEEETSQPAETENKTPEKIGNNFNVVDDADKGSSCKKKLFVSEHKENKKSKKNILKDDFKEIDYSSEDEKTSDTSFVAIKTLSEIKRSQINPFVDLGKSSNVGKGKRSASDLEDSGNIDGMTVKKKCKLSLDNMSNGDESQSDEQNSPVREINKSKKKQIKKEKSLDDSDLSEHSVDSQFDEQSSPVREIKKSKKKQTRKKKSLNDTDMSENGNGGQSDEQRSSAQKTKRSKKNQTKKKKHAKKSLYDGDLSENSDDAESDEQSLLATGGIKKPREKKEKAKPMEKDNDYHSGDETPMNKANAQKNKTANGIMKEDKNSDVSGSENETSFVRKGERRSDGREISSSEDSSDSISKTKPVSKHGDSKKKESLDKIHTHPKIIKMKSYLRFAGIRIKNYSEFWLGCKSVKSRVDKIVQHLQNMGLKGYPTKNSCTKLRLKLDRKKEIQELDMSNILDTPNKEFTGKRTRNNASKKEAVNKAHEKQYARLRMLCSSSDED